MKEFLLYLGRISDSYLLYRNNWFAALLVLLIVTFFSFSVYVLLQEPTPERNIVVEKVDEALLDALEEKFEELEAATDELGEVAEGITTDHSVTTNDVVIDYDPELTVEFNEEINKPLWTIFLDEETNTIIMELGEGVTLDQAASEFFKYLLDPYNQEIWSQEKCNQRCPCDFIVTQEMCDETCPCYCPDDAPLLTPDLPEEHELDWEDWGLNVDAQDRQFILHSEGGIQ